MNYSSNYMRECQALIYSSTHTHTRPFKIPPLHPAYAASAAALHYTPELFAHCSLLPPHLTVPNHVLMEESPGRNSTQRSPVLLEIH